MEIDDKSVCFNTHHLSDLPDGTVFRQVGNSIWWLKGPWATGQSIHVTRLCDGFQSTSNGDSQVRRYDSRLVIEKRT